MTAMLVETFEVTEDHPDLSREECSQEQVALIEQLGLEGQKKLVSRDDDGDAKVLPYPKMTAEQRKVIEQICPKKTKLSDYADQAIPLRVLQVAAHAKEACLFDAIEVWHPENADEKDPYLIGRIGEPHASGTSRYMLARWADELLPWAELVRKAGVVIKRKRLVNLRKILAKCQAEIEATEKSSCDEAVEFDDGTSIYSW